MSGSPYTPPAPPPHERNGCMTVITVGIGVLLLLPGICALIIAGFDPKEALGDPTTLIAFLTFLALGAGGVALIWRALRR